MRIIQEPEESVDTLDSQPKEVSEPKVRKSRKKLPEDFVPKPRVGPNLDEPVPTVVFHGILQICKEILLRNLVEQIEIGTGGYAECIEIGLG